MHRPVGLQSTTTGLSSCSAWVSFPWSTWGLSGPGIEPTSPASAGGFLTTGALEKFSPFLNDIPHSVSQHTIVSGLLLLVFRLLVPFSPAPVCLLWTLSVMETNNNSTALWITLGVNYLGGLSCVLLDRRGYFFHLCIISVQQVPGTSRIELDISECVNEHLTLINHL